MKRYATSGYQISWYGDDFLKMLQEASPDAYYDAGQILIDTAKSGIHDRSGKLAASGYVANEKKSTYRRRKIYNKEVKAPPGGAVAAFAAFYGHYLEYGTKHSAARPFFRPAIDELKERLGHEISVRLRAKINK